MSSICFYFQVHQPWRVKRFRHSDIGADVSYFDDRGEGDIDNEWVLKKVAGKSYLPANEMFLELLEKHPDLKLSFSISGVVLEQMERFSTETLRSFQRLVETGRVEILAETYYHSLAYFYSIPEFERQVEMHEEKVKSLFGVTPEVFRNTELSYTNSLGLWAEKRGYKAVLAEGWDYYLGWRSPNFLYRPLGTRKIKLLLKNYRLSDDIAFRFSEKTWEGWPLTAERFAEWVNRANGNGDVVNLFMDYETLGEHQWEDTGIFDFMRELPGALLSHPDNDFMTVSEAAENYPARDTLDIPNILTWADMERDLSAWRGNEMQEAALAKLYSLENAILEGNSDLVERWRYLQTSDHFYYMCTKWFNDGDVHAYFSPYESPYDAFRYFMNVLTDLKFRITKT